MNEGETTARFVAYIDEAGDPGFKFVNRDGSKGSSEWFIISAIDAPRQNHSTLCDEMNGHAQSLGRGGRLHFVDMRHHQRLAWLAELAKTQVWATSVITHKRSLERTAPDSWRLYFYMVRYLLERICRLCTELCEPGEDRHAQIILSNCGKLPYKELCNYIELLCDREQIDRKVISADSLSMGVPSKYPCLWAADAMASSIAQALEYDRNFKTLEHRYLKMLKPIIYKGTDYRSCGMKLHPHSLRQNMDCDPRIEWMKRHYW